MRGIDGGEAGRIALYAKAPMPNGELCLVLAPLDSPSGSAVVTAAFEGIFERVIVPVLRELQLEPLGPAATANIPRTRLLEWAVLSQRVIADVSFPDAELAYRLGQRQLVNRGPTVLLYADQFGGRPPPQLGRAIRYGGDASSDLQLQQQVSEHLRHGSGAWQDAALYQLPAR
jgi:hypothetical protein